MMSPLLSNLWSVGIVGVVVGLAVTYVIWARRIEYRQLNRLRDRESMLSAEWEKVFHLSLSNNRQTIIEVLTILAQSLHVSVFQLRPTDRFDSDYAIRHPLMIDGPLDVFEHDLKEYLRAKNVIVPRFSESAVTLRTFLSELDNAIGKPGTGTIESCMDKGT